MKTIRCVCVHVHIGSLPIRSTFARAFIFFVYFLYFEYKCMQFDRKERTNDVQVHMYIQHQQHNIPLCQLVIIMIIINFCFTQVEHLKFREIFTPNSAKKNDEFRVDFIFLKFLLLHVRFVKGVRTYGCMLPDENERTNAARHAPVNVS